MSGYLPIKSMAIPCQRLYVSQKMSSGECWSSSNLHVSWWKVDALNATNTNLPCLWNESPRIKPQIRSFDFKQIRKSSRLFPMQEQWNPPKNVPNMSDNRRTEVVKYIRYSKLTQLRSSTWFFESRIFKVRCPTCEICFKRVLQPFRSIRSVWRDLSPRSRLLEELRPNKNRAIQVWTLKNLKQSRWFKHFQS